MFLVIDRAGIAEQIDQFSKAYLKHQHCGDLSAVLCLHIQWL